MNKKWFLYFLNILTISVIFGVAVWYFKTKTSPEKINLNDSLVTNNSPSQKEAESQQTFNQETYGYFSSELWPGEGIPRFRAKRDLNLAQKPSLESPLLEDAIITKGSLVNFSRTLLITKEPVQVTLKQDMKATGTNYGKRKFLSQDDYYNAGEVQDIYIAAGQVINVLQYRAEGNYFYEFAGEIYASNCPVCSSVEPTIKWWIKSNVNKISGWILINDESVEFLEREF